MTPAWGDIMMEPLRKVPQSTEFVALSQMAPHGDYCFRLTCWSAQLNIYGSRELGRGSGRGLAKRGARLRSSERSLHAGPACRSSPPLLRRVTQTGNIRHCPSRYQPSAPSSSHVGQRVGSTLVASARSEELGRGFLRGRWHGRVLVVGEPLVDLPRGLVEAGRKTRAGERPGGLLHL